MTTVHKLITKEIAAELLSVSKRTIDYWVADRTLPMPTTIGGRRVYWHPEVFAAWQDKTFNRQPEASADPTSERRPRGRPRTRTN